MLQFNEYEKMNWRGAESVWMSYWTYCINAVNLNVLGEIVLEILCSLNLKEKLDLWPLTLGQGCWDSNFPARAHTVCGVNLNILGHTVLELRPMLTFWWNRCRLQCRGYDKGTTFSSNQSRKTSIKLCKWHHFTFASLKLLQKLDAITGVDKTTFERLRLSDLFAPQSLFILLGWDDT